MPVLHHGVLAAGEGVELLQASDREVVGAYGDRDDLADGPADLARPDRVDGAGENLQLLGQRAKETGLFRQIDHL